MGMLGNVVSSRLDFIKKNPDFQFSNEEIKHEIKHLRNREKISLAITGFSGVLAGVLLVVGILGGGALILAALVAVALLSATYAYACENAERSLKKGRDLSMIYAKEDENQLIDQLKNSFLFPLLGSETKEERSLLGSETKEERSLLGSETKEERK